MLNPLVCYFSITEPVVQGNIISWPADGWYQVQRADNYSSVCEGGNSCTVDAGTYIVINHDSGVRTPITVVAENGSDTTTPIEDGPVVTGSNVAQLPIIGTKLPLNRVSSVNYTVDGVSIFSEDGFALAALCS